MGLYKAEGVVLRTRNLGEADKIVILYTREAGKVGAVARGARRVRSRLLGSTQLFAHGRYLLYEGKNLHTLSQGELVRAFRRLREDLTRMAYASYLAELTDVAIEEGEPHEAVFVAFVRALALLEDGDADDLALRWYESRLMQELGYGMRLDDCSVCESAIEQDAWASAESGGLLCGRCRQADAAAQRLSAGVLGMLRRIAASDGTRLSVLRPNPADRRLMAQVLRRHIDFRLRRRIKSAEFLATLESMS